MNKAELAFEVVTQLFAFFENFKSLQPGDTDALPPIPFVYNGVHYNFVGGIQRSNTQTLVNNSPDFSVLPKL